jgi:hypothetical protein
MRKPAGKSNVRATHSSIIDLQLTAVHGELLAVAALV